MTCLLLVLLTWSEDARPALVTTAEKSNYEATSRHAEVMSFCQELAKQSPHVQLTSMGKSKEGRDLPLLVLANPPIKSAAEAKASGKPIVMAFANIHAGEVEGKEALQMLARDLVLPKPDPLLDKVIILLNPIFNADGNEKIDPKHRTHQGGPKEGVGLRANADGLDLNRDFVKLKSPEVRALTACWNEWDPLLIVDCHSTNGSYHRHLITYDGPRHPAADAGVRSYSEKTLLPDLTKRLKKLGGWDAFFYGYFTPDRSSWESYPPQPRYGIQAIALRNRFGILSEAYTYAPFKERVLATRDFVRANFDAVADNATVVKKLCADADAKAAAGGEPIVLTFKTTACPDRYNVLGFVEEKVEGRTKPTSVPKEYPVIYLGACEPTLTTKRPAAYYLPPEPTAVIETLKAHGIQVEEVKSALELEGERFHLSKVKRAENAFQGIKSVKAEGEWRPEKFTVPAGWYRVSTRQPKGNLASFILEPQADDGLLTWDFFGDAIAEGKTHPVLRSFSNAPTEQR